MNLEPAIEQLRQSLEVVRTNEPINRKEGNKEQADLEKDNARSYRAAIRLLGKKAKPTHFARWKI